MTTISAQQNSNIKTPVSWWKFDKADNNKIIDDIAEIQDTIRGQYKLIEGAKGNCLKLDGYTTNVIRKAYEVPILDEVISIEAWVALQALPWNWSAIVSQGGNEIATVEEELPEVDFKKLTPGLIGAQFGNANLTDPLGKQELISTDNDWTGAMRDWSNRWRGYIEAPFTGDIIFSAEADDGLQLLINDEYVIDGWKTDGARTGNISLVKGEKYPVILNYGNDGGQAILRLFWKWEGKTEELIPISAFGYSEKDNIMATRDIIPPRPPEPFYEQKIFLGVDAYGHLGFMLNVNGELHKCVSDRKLPLLKWSHVAATFSQADGMKIFINGAIAGELNVKGNITPVLGSDLLIGMNIQKLGPVGSERHASEKILSEMVIDGLIDEVKIYNTSLSIDDVVSNYKEVQLVNEQPLCWEKMPSGPETLPNSFDAVYTRLNYRDEWESPYRVTEYPDILIHFDALPVRFIFWRGTSYGGAWITENGLWMGDQSLERSNANKSPMGCSEHMSDKQTRYSSVRIIEKNDARIVLQWRYAVSDIIYDIFGTNTGYGWGEWADEYYFIYPDGVSTRHQILWTNFLSHEWQETIVLNHPGTYPEDNINLDAITLVNMKGEMRTYSWKEHPPKSFPEPVDANIQMVNLKSEYKPFIIFEPGPKIKPMNGSREGFSHFTWWNHWPIAQLPNDGRKAFGPDRASHTSLSQSIEESQVIHKRDDDSYTVVTLVGLTDKPAASLATLSRSWNNPPELIMKDDGNRKSYYNKNERAYIISNSNRDVNSEINFVVNGNHESPIVNLALVIQDYESDEIELEINGDIINRGDSFRYGFRNTLEGRDLVVWLNVESKKLLNIIIRPINK